MSALDLYAVLGLTRTADLADIRQAYLAAVRKSHPDKSPLATEGHAQIGLVYRAWQVCLLAAKRHCD